MIEYEFFPVLSRASIEDYEGLFKDVYGPSKKLSVEYLRWLYQANPSGGAVGIDAYLDGELAAHYVTVPRVYKRGNRSVRCLLSVNTATHPNHQRRGLFKSIAMQTYESASSQGFEAVFGVANAQSIHAFTTSLGFSALGNVRLAIRGSALLDDDRNRYGVDQTDRWMAWRLAQPAADYKLITIGSNIFVSQKINGVRFLLGRVSEAQASASGILMERRHSPVYVTPYFPANKRGILIPASLQPSPWHVIYKPLGKEQPDDSLRSVIFDGLSMDTF